MRGSAFDPATRVFRSSGVIDFSWQQQTATLLADGRVLLAGGYGYRRALQGEVVGSSAELWNRTDGSLVVVSMQSSRGDQTATLLADGTVLIAGGTADDKNAVSSVELFRP